MNCRDAHDLLQQTLDGTPAESPEWLDHLRQCADCRALASAGRRLQDGLRFLTVPLPPADLAMRIAERVLRDRRHARNRLRRRWAIGLALAASLLLALTGIIRQLTLPVRSPALANRQRQLPGDWPARTEKSAPTLRESAAEIGEVFSELSNETAEETVEQTRRWVSSAVLSPEFRVLSGAGQNSELRAQNSELQAAGEGLSEGLEPVTTSARRAVDLFLRELPMEIKTN